jgi:hypothetical protein
MIPYCSFSLIKCQSISTCLVQSCWIGLWAILITTLLSQYNLIESSNPSSFKNIFNHNISHSMSHGYEFCFCTGYGNHWLFLATPCNQITSHKGAIPWCGPLIHNWANPICISIDFYFQMIMSRKQQSFTLWGF